MYLKNVVVRLKRIVNIAILYIKVCIDEVEINISEILLAMFAYFVSMCGNLSDLLQSRYRDHCR